MTITVVLAALALQSGIFAVKGDCPKLPSIQLARPFYPWCTTQSSPVNRTCTFVCVYGYSLKNDPNLASFRFVCQPNGTWSGKVYQCVDTRRPDMQCPDDITVIARPGSPSEMVSWKIDVDDNSLPVDPDAKVTVHSSHVSPHNFTIGRHGVSVIVTDKNGNKATCWFRVIVRDLEPPTCSFCPGDIVKVAKHGHIRVTWDRPVCSDNSHLPPMITANRHNGDHFGAPGTHKIQYKVKDHDPLKPNIYTGCSFTITLKRAKCPMYPPPKNGALVCLNRDDGSQLFCQVACKTGTDFLTNPGLLYACPDSGQWQIYSPFPQTSGQLPWPDCASGAGPSLVTSLGLSEFFYNANQKPSEVELELKEHFLKFARGRFVPPWYCKLSGMHNGCQPDKVRVYV